MRLHSTPYADKQNAVYAYCTYKELYYFFVALHNSDYKCINTSPLGLNVYICYQNWMWDLTVVVLFHSDYKYFNKVLRNIIKSYTLII